MTNSQGIAEESKPMSRYSMVVVAAKRAKQIKEGAPVLIDTESTNPLTIAMEEIAQGKVTVNDSAVTQAPVTKKQTDPASAPRVPRLKETHAEPLPVQSLTTTVDSDEDEDADEVADSDDTEASADATDDDTSDEDAA